MSPEERRHAILISRSGLVSRTPRHWLDFHNTLAAEIRSLLNEQLDPNLATRHKYKGGDDSFCRLPFPSTSCEQGVLPPSSATRHDLTGAGFSGHRA
jgi:hypothetical protein